MENNKKILKILIIVFIILIIVLLILKKVVKKQEDDAPEEAYYYGTEEIDYDYTQVTFKEYLQIKNCLQIFANAINTDSSSYYGRNDEGEYTKVFSDEEIKNLILDLLDDTYLQENGINLNNLNEYVKEYTENKIVIPIYVKKGTDEDAKVSMYGVEAIVISANDRSINEKIYAVVNIDYENKTFSIELINSKNNLDKYSYDNQKNSIEKNDNNIFYSEVITNQKIAEDYFFNFKNLILADKNIIYENLNKEYREKRFSSYEDFENYCEKVSKIIEKSRVVEYEATQNDDGMQYVCIDQYNNTYIFNEKNVLDYDIILDLYTIELPEFTEKYDESSAQEKVALNIEKFKQALNYADYNYAYSKLDSAFKENNFQSLESFKEYITANLYNNIKISYEEFNNEGTVYIYDVEIQNLEDNNSEAISMQIVMKLLDDRDFVMSFNIK